VPPLLAAAAGNKSPLIAPFLTVLAWTGMRADEARTLRCHQIDFEAGRNGRVVVGKSKTTAGRGCAIPMSGPLRTTLERHAAWYARWYARHLGPIQPDWYVFPMCNRVQPVDPNRPVRSLKTAWNTVREKSGVTCRLHDLRHSFCTKLAESGAAESVMLDMMGHVSRALDRFGELRPVLVDLGRRHVTYGVQPYQYERLRSALVWAMGQALGLAFDKETRAAWDQLLSTISAVMLEAASAAAVPLEKRL